MIFYSDVPLLVFVRAEESGGRSIFVWVAGSGGIQRCNQSAVFETGRSAFFWQSPAPCDGRHVCGGGAYNLWLLCVYHLTHLTTVFTINEV